MNIFLQNLVILQAMRIYRTVHKNSDDYEKIDITSKEENASWIELTQLYYNYFFKIYCLMIFCKVFSNKIEQLRIYTKKKTTQRSWSSV